MPSRTFIQFTTITACGLVCVAASAETATAPPISFQLSIGQSAVKWVDPFGTSPDATIWDYAGGASISKSGGVAYSVFANPDPVLGFDLLFTNETEQTQVFNLQFTLPVTPWAGATLIGATIGASVTDANLNGYAQLSSIGSAPIFSGFIDGNPWMPLFEGVSETVLSTGGTAFLSDADGMPGPTKPGPFGVSDTISISLQFELSAGDSAAFSGAWIVEYVPSPAGALVLLGLGFVGRRRR